MRAELNFFQSNNDYNLLIYEIFNLLKIPMDPNSPWNLPDYKKFKSRFYYYREEFDHFYNDLSNYDFSYLFRRYTNLILDCSEFGGELNYKENILKLFPDNNYWRLQPKIKVNIRLYIATINLLSMIYKMKEVDKMTDSSIFRHLEEGDQPLVALFSNKFS